MSLLATSVSSHSHIFSVSIAPSLFPMDDQKAGNISHMEKIVSVNYRILDTAAAFCGNIKAQISHSHINICSIRSIDASAGRDSDPNLYSMRH